MARYNPRKLPLVVAVSLVAVASALLWWRFEVRLVYAYLVSISGITLLFYGYDKRQALKNGWRVPEVVLHILALSGGSPGAVAGQMLFRHKTRKLRFKAVFAAIVLVQLVAGVLFWHYRIRNP